MKKLKLKLDGVKEMLTREQMKKVSGGYGPPDDLCDPGSIFYSPWECPCTNEAPCPEHWIEYRCPDDSCVGRYDILCRAPNDTDHCE